MEGRNERHRAGTTDEVGRAQIYVTVNDKHSMEVIVRNPEFNLAKRIADARESIPIESARSDTRWELKRSYIWRRSTSV